MCVKRICLLTLLSLTLVSWGNASQSQYHIQTDEGPERYFRFQTDNGQFRKEKRLQDGTVIGTEAWIDAAGFLRQKDYIADKQGYRILKSKTIFVGQGRGIEDAIKSTKAAPAQSGVLVDGNAGGNSIASSSGSGYQKAGYVYASTTTTTTTPAPAVAIPLEYEQSAILASGVGKLNYLPPEQAAQIEPQTQLGFDHYPDELPRARDQLLSVSPVVHIQPNSEPLDELPNAINVYDEEADRAFGHGQFGSVISSTTTTPRPASLYTPSLDMLPPAFSSHRRRLRPRPRPSAIAIVASTPSPIASQEAFAYSTPKPFAAPPPQFPLHVDTGYQYVTPPTVSVADGYSPLEVNSLDTAPALLPPLPDRAYRQRLRPVHSNHLDSAAEYDGVSVNRNGFRYVLPKQYHEEQQIGEKRAGSFGYVDPFGIRRVVYYNASPGRGFVHRNNNQFVGANGAPYDEPGPAQLVNE